MWSYLITLTLVLAASQVQAQSPQCKEADIIANMNIMIQIVSFCDNGTDLEYLQKTAEKLASCPVQGTGPIIFKLIEFISKLNIKTMSCLSATEVSKILKKIVCNFIDGLIDKQAGTIINNLKNMLDGALNGIKGPLGGVKSVLSFLSAPPPEAPNVKYSPNGISASTSASTPTATPAPAQAQKAFNPFGWLGR